MMDGFSGSEALSASARTARPTDVAAAIGRTTRPLGGGVKRVLDIVLSAAVLVFAAPAFILIALAVRLESAGPAIFAQRRGGALGKIIKVYKFRTMTVCDDGHVVKQASQGDARVTPLGAFLRRTSLDELPQFYNVLRGDMSIVGPRPHALAHDAAFERVDPRYRLRTRARPGITGLAQISGARGPTKTDDAVRRRVSYDLDYISNWSLGLDIAIIGRTIVRLSRDPNAF